MKRLFFIALLVLTQNIKSCNLCLGYTGRMLRQQSIEKIQCDCNCEQQYHVQWDDKQGYGCIRCGHRLLPRNPFKNESSQIRSTPIKKPQKYSNYKTKHYYQKNNAKIHH